MAEQHKQGPYLSVRDRMLSVSFFKKERQDMDGAIRTVYSANLQRCYTVKDSDELKHESLNLFPDDLLKVSALCIRAYNQLISVLQDERKKERDQEKKKSYPAQSMSAPDALEELLDDNVPF